eukprot:15338907-Ditylum_brightwellii.AAC.1
MNLLSAFGKVFDATDSCLRHGSRCVASAVALKVYNEFSLRIFIMCFSTTSASAGTRCKAALHNITSMSALKYDSVTVPHALPCAKDLIAL